jgi:hypothetical protein
MRSSRLVGAGSVTTWLTCSSTRIATPLLDSSPCRSYGEHIIGVRGHPVSLRLGRPESKQVNGPPVTGREILNSRLSSPTRQALLIVCNIRSGRPRSPACRTTPGGSWVRQGSVSRRTGTRGILKERRELIRVETAPGKVRGWRHEWRHISRMVTGQSSCSAAM